jgi:hypothetical protein
MKNQRIRKAPKKESKIGILISKVGCRLTKKSTPEHKIPPMKPTMNQEIIKAIQYP